MTNQSCQKSHTLSLLYIYDQSIELWKTTRDLTATFSKDWMLVIH